MNLWRSINKKTVTGFIYWKAVAKTTTRNPLQGTVQSGRIVKLECGQKPIVKMSRNAPLRSLRAQQFNNLNVRKFFKVN